MATVIKANDSQRLPRVASFSFDDMSQQADRYVQQVRTQAEQIVQQARQEADAIRKQAHEQGRAAGEQAIAELVKQQVGRQMETLLPALRQAVTEIADSRQGWLMHWEQRTVHLAAAIAGRIARREAQQAPEITLSLVQEALKLAAGKSLIRVLLHPDDHRALGEQIRQIVGELAAVADAEVSPDETISRGGCRVETRHGAVDQQFEAQLARIEAELN